MPLPTAIAKKISLLNIENRDDSKCLVWCLIAALERQNGLKRLNPKRVTPYLKSDIKLDMTGVQYPVSINQVISS